MTPPTRPSTSFTVTQMRAIGAAPAAALGIKIERVALAGLVIVADVAGSIFFHPPWWAAAALFVLALLLAAPGLVVQAIQALINAAKDAKGLRTDDR